MADVLIATEKGCRLVRGCEETATELDGRAVSFLAKEPDGKCLAIVDECEIWRRDLCGDWLQIARAEIALQSLTSLDGVVFAGGLNEAAMLRVGDGGVVARLRGFDLTSGRDKWFAGGPPLGVRSLAVTSDRSAILAGVHVGGIARSVDGGVSWAPTIPVEFDVHEVCAHPSLPGFVAAACAVGLCLSDDGGAGWRLLADGLGDVTSLAVAVFGDEVLFSVQDGPFASRSQIWRWREGSGLIGPVGDGLPEWLDGKVDTGHIAAGEGFAAVVDSGGNLWLYEAGSTGWKQVTSALGYVSGIALV